MIALLSQFIRFDVYYPPEVSSMKYCRLEVFRKEVVLTSGNKTNRKTALNYLKNSTHLWNFGNGY